MSGINLFFDSSALVSGIVSATGAARALLLLAETDHVTLTISEQVVVEGERTLARKAPRALSDFRQAILATRARIVRDPSQDEVNRSLDLMAHAAEAPIVLAAKHAQVDCLVTLNRKHFIDDPRVAERSGLFIAGPGDALFWVRQRLAGG